MEPVTSSILCDRLVAEPGRATEIVTQLDRGSAPARRAALEVLETLVEDFVCPVSEELTSDGDGHYHFDLQRTTGSRVPGLALGLLASRFPGLQEAPDDDTLAAALEELGIEIRGAESRETFFRVWMAQRAIHVGRHLLEVVEENLNDEPEADAWELSALGRLASLSLPSIERSLIGSVIHSRRATRRDG